MVILMPSRLSSNDSHSRRRPSRMFRSHALFALAGGLSIAASAAAQSSAPAVVPTPAFDIPRPPALPALGKDGPQVEQLTFDVAVKRALDSEPDVA